MASSTRPADREATTSPRDAVAAANASAARAGVRGGNDARLAILMLVAIAAVVIAAVAIAWQLVVA